MSNFDFTYIALGAGVQSSALLILSNQGVVQRADVAIFADTGDEPRWVYDHLERLKESSEISIHVAQEGHLSVDLVGALQGERPRFASVPAFTLGQDGREAPVPRQCTREYKITPIERKVRELLGYEPRQRIKESVGAMIGISLDELHRMRPSRARWVTNTYPLVDLRYDRHKCLRVIQDAGMLIPGKSSCVFCPYHSAAYWRNLKANHPDEWEGACEFDEAIRDQSKKGANNPIFVHRSLVPLREAYLGEDQGSLFGEECEGYCGV